ncbi:Egg cell-secreted protein 1-4 [Nymphaea thermarum]|nr:Egg cell-secreted protein 1-4 [Nymphaea thermarum]
MASMAKFTVILLIASIMSAASGLESPFRLAVVQKDGGLMQCWDALAELKACSGEIILFFLNGEAYLGPGCCNAIQIITHDCWPSLLTAFGFTAQEGDILRGFCDAVVAEPPESGDEGAAPPHVGDGGI